MRCILYTYMYEYALGITHNAGIAPNVQTGEQEQTQANDDTAHERQHIRGSRVSRHS